MKFCVGFLNVTLYSSHYMFVFSPPRMDRDRPFGILCRDGSGSGLLSALILHYGIARLLSGIKKCNSIFPVSGALFLRYGIAPPLSVASPNRIPFVWCTIFLSTVMHSFLVASKNVIPFSLRLVHHFSVMVLHNPLV